jgi:hypothetical protein
MALESSPEGRIIIDIPFPKQQYLVDVDLIPEGDRADIPSRVTSIVSVSELIASPLDLNQIAKDNPHLRAYLQQLRRTHEVKSLSFACSFASNSHPVIRAAVEVSLTRNDQATDVTPIAWCLEPSRIDKPASSFPAKLSFEIALPPKAKVEVGPRQESVHKERYILLAHGEGTATPGWLFRRTSQHDFDGIHWLGMVVLLPRKAPVTAQISLAAAIRYRKLGIIPCSADLPSNGIQPVSLIP